MDMKKEIIAELREERSRWEEFLTGLPEEKILASMPESQHSIKDVIAHLHAWQQVSIARLHAALHGGEPVLPRWLNGLDPDSDDNLENYNEHIFQSCRNHSWHSVYQRWHSVFSHFLDLAEQIPADDLMAAGKYPWLAEYPLSAVLQGSLEHHQEHLKPLLTLYPKDENL
jgi:hypothetical protein